MKKLEVKNLTKYYGKTLGIKDVSFYLNEGEIFGFIGPNGAGKSTTIRSIMNLINKEGTVLIDGKEYNNYKMNSLIGYLPGEINLYDDLTVKQMLDYNEKFYNTTNRKKLVKRFKLDESKRIEDLSLGNLKKLGIILTFMHDPEILILDEPTNGLDPIMQEELHKLIMEEKQNGKTILYSSHVLSEVSRICDRVGIIRDGSLIFVDTIECLTKNSLNIITIESIEKDSIKEKLEIDIIEEKKNYIKFKTQLSSDKLIKELAKFKIDKIIIQEPTLEDIVMEYYK